MEVMVVKKVINNYFSNKNIVAIMGEESDLSILLEGYELIKYNHNFKVKTFIKKNIELLKKLNLNEEILNKKIKDLSSTELKFILLIRAINLKPELIILNDFEVGIPPKYYNPIFHLIQNTVLNHNIKFLVLSNNPKFLNKITKKVIIFKNKIIKYQGDLITASRQGIIEYPEILKFIDLANKKGAELVYTLDSKELLKDIYRGIS